MHVHFQEPTDHPPREKGLRPSRNSEEDPGLVPYGSSPPDTKSREAPRRKERGRNRRVKGN